MRLPERLRPVPPHSDERRSALVAFFAAIAFPSYEEAQLAQIVEAARRVSEVRLSDLGLHEDLALWLWHGLARAEVSWDSVCDFAAPTAEERKAAIRESFSRMDARDRLQGHFAKKDIRAVWLKGAALLDRYEAPFVRPMCDLDLATSAAAEHELLCALEESGWHRRSRHGATFAREDGLLLDVHVAASSFADRLLERAVQCEFGHWLPAAEDHLPFLAEHLFASAGEPLWKTIADARACGAMHGDAFPPSLDAMNALIAVRNDPVAALTGEPRNDFQRLLQRTAAEPNGAALLHLARQAFSPRMPSYKAPAGSTATVEIPSVMLAAIPRKERMMGALWLFATGWRDPAARAVLQTARLQRKTSLPNDAFRAPMEG